MNHGRREFMKGAAASTLLMTRAAAFLGADQSRAQTLRVGSNPGTENATLDNLMRDRGYFDELSLDVRIVESRSVSGPMEALLSGEADICMVSAFVGVLP